MIIELIVIISFVMMHFIEFFSFSSRAGGKLSGNTTLGTTFHYSMHTASRFLLIIFLPSIAFMVETMTKLDNFLIVPVISLLICFSLNLIVILKFNYAQMFFQQVFKLYSESNNLFLSLFKALYIKNENSETAKHIEQFSLKKLTPRKYLASCIAYLFLNTGFYAAFLFSLIFYKYRLTISQFSSMIHGFGALIVAFYLDPMLSRSIDESLIKDRWASDMYSILFGRMLSYLFAFLIFLTIYLFVI
jgi:hypothetical protein